MDINSVTITSRFMRYLGVQGQTTSLLKGCGYSSATYGTMKSVLVSETDKTDDTVADCVLYSLGPLTEDRKALGRKMEEES